MLQHIYQYYLGEKSGVIYALSTGVIFLLTGIFLLLKFHINPISKGLGTGLVIAGIILITGSFSTQYYNNQKIKSLVERKAETETQLQKSEIQRMDKVMNVTFHYAFITFAMLVIGLSLVILFSKSFYWKGFSIAFIMMILFIWIADTYNSKRNAEYFEMVKSYIS
ncbi:hypothetical protein J2810_001088 [Chryseobacterium rhizosphaerae]|jgi:hypothetical protein|uniref:hypothetical protein n=1 Tax=Chryseobacterium rhizosphaerae TaxID=395937 RepID=UPI000645B0DB|nr:hypothetical protein [Chryseobacterium rhizosphaerae]MDR6545046.1 hypothetical protein [Chryseobacterium rhizosphaerae]